MWHLYLIVVMVEMSDFDLTTGEVICCLLLLLIPLFSLAKDKEAYVFSQYNIVEGVRDWNVQFIRAIGMSLVPPL